MHPNSANPYRDQAVATASPAQLVLMLYDGALAALLRARSADEEPSAARIETVNRELQRAQRIVTELRCTLDHERGGDIARSLAALYDFCQDRLVAANTSKQLDGLDAVERVLGELRDAWEQACCRAPAPVGSP